MSHSKGKNTDTALQENFSDFIIDPSLARDDYLNDNPLDSVSIEKQLTIDCVGFA